MSGFRLAVDYGSSNTVAVLGWPDGRVRPLLFGGSPVLPSAVHVDHGGRFLVGADAYRAARLDPARFEANPKRRIDQETLLLGDAEVRVVDLIAATLHLLSGLTQIESCYSVAGMDFYLLMVRVESPAGLEHLLREIRKAANVTTRTTVVLSTPVEGRAPR